MSLPFRVDDAVRWTEGDLLRGDAGASLRGVSIDTRSIEPGALFVAIAGPNHDAHAFLESAVRAGASGLLVERGRALPDPLPDDLAAIAVDDTTRALGHLAAGHRASFDGPVVAITGSNGKTTTKEMCAAILSVRGPCLKNPGNLNNQFGLPLTLLRRDASDRAAVVEIGMNRRGEVAALAGIARPTVGVLTNVGTAHIEHLGSRDEIAREKGDLVASLAPDAAAVLNADDPRVAAQAGRTAARVVRYGRGPDADVRAESVVARDRGFAFALAARFPAPGRAEVEVAGLGAATVENALAAAAGALAAGATLADVAIGLGRYVPVAGRLSPRRLTRGGVLIDDTYNANPQSLELALRALADHRGDARAVAVLGDMGELGAESEGAHRDAGRRAAELGIDFLVSVGRNAARMAAGAVGAGLEPECARPHETVASAVADLEKLLAPGDCVLVKGSRAMRMERIVEALAAEESD